MAVVACFLRETARIWRKIQRHVFFYVSVLTVSKTTITIYKVESKTVVKALLLTPAYSLKQRCLNVIHYVSLRHKRKIKQY